MLMALLSTGLLLHAAQEDREKDKKQEEKQKTVLHLWEYVTVTATMTRKAVKDCSASVSIVDEQDLNSVSANHALNALDHLPGIFVQRTGDFGRADVEIRGLG